MDIDCLNEEFFNYQMLSSDVIPKAVKESVSLRAYDPHHVDVLWGYPRGLKDPGVSDLHGLLFK